MAVARADVRPGGRSRVVAAGRAAPARRLPRRRAGPSRYVPRAPCRTAVRWRRRCSWPSRTTACATVPRCRARPAGRRRRPARRGRSGRSDEASGHVSGRVVGLALPAHADFRALRRAPAEVQADLRARGWQRVAAVVPSGPLLPGDLAAARLAVPDADGLLVITSTRPEHPHDDGHFARARLHRAALAGRTDVVQVLLPVPAVLDSARRECRRRGRTPVSTRHPGDGALSLDRDRGRGMRRDGARRRRRDGGPAGPAAERASAIDVVAVPAVGFDAHRRTVDRRRRAAVRPRRAGARPRHRARRCRSGRCLPTWPASCAATTRRGTCGGSRCCSPGCPAAGNPRSRAS